MIDILERRVSCKCGKEFAGEVVSVVQKGKRVLLSKPHCPRCGQEDKVEAAHLITKSD